MFAASIDLRAVFLFLFGAHFDADPLRVLNRLSHAAFRQIQSDILCTDPVIHKGWLLHQGVFSASHDGKARNQIFQDMKRKGNRHIQ